MRFSSARFQLQRYAGARTRFTCPKCHTSKTFTRWIDTVTNELLPEQFGSCDRADKCGYFNSPYISGLNELSYYQETQQVEKQPISNLRPLKSAKPKRALPPLCFIPEEVVEQTKRRYSSNVFAQLLLNHFGAGVATDLLCRFDVGTSAHWPGATIFWQRDKLGRARGGQVVLFDAQGHTVKEDAPNGRTKRCTDWVHTAYAAHCRKHNLSQPSWLISYLDPNNEVQKSPSLYGLAQVSNISADSPVAIVESTKTAIICTPYLPAFTWLAVGGLTYLNADRLRSVREHPITLYPDASTDGSAYRRWSEKAAELNQAGFRIQVADVLERQANNAQKVAGFDLADLLLEQWPGYPPSWDQ
ncbi:DUF6371 domain-containing protein [Hymenobacter volaticus]|uniref:DUF6371 domain-containing protein n=1 Tax=Hymenobacter volaticus TaxID=2932254 RepID=A0ABY4G517_9BACT|nr:DUF6371 domain-containing protein [Hymenobacter volaticus]UOQ65719.1 DUF6371 domain-containing protein [Hymenobacter volaticus]